MKRMLTALSLLAASCAHAAPLTVTIARIVEDVSVRQGEGEWVEAKQGQVLTEGQEIHTGPGSEATLAFSDGTAVVVRELSELKFGVLLARGDRVKMELLLKIGDVKAAVKPQTTVRTDFSVRTPSGTASVRGTEIKSISCYPSTGMITQLQSGVLFVQTAKGATTMETGDQTHVSSDGELKTATETVRDEARVDVQPGGLTAGEQEQIDVNNQPGITVPTGAEDAMDAAAAAGATLVLRVNRQ